MSDAPEQLPQNLSLHPPRRRQFFSIVHAIEKEAMAQAPVSGNLDHEGNQGTTNQVYVPGSRTSPLLGIPMQEYKEADTLLLPRLPAQPNRARAPRRDHKKESPPLEMGSGTRNFWLQ